MGGSASILSPEDFVMMSQDLKEVYDNLILEGHTDDEIRSQLMNKYAHHLQEKKTVGEEIVDPAATSSPVPTDLDGESDKEDPSMAPLIDGLAVAGIEEQSNQENIEPKPALTEKAKKARKRRGTFENDTVVNSKPTTSAIEAPIEIVAG
jgi:hypothetical protein